MAKASWNSVSLLIIFMSHLGQLPIEHPDMFFVAYHIDCLEHILVKYMPLAHDKEHNLQIISMSVKYLFVTGRHHVLTRFMLQTVDMYRVYSSLARYTLIMWLNPRPYTAPCNGVVSHGAQIGGHRVFTDYARKNKCKTNASMIFGRRTAFYACFILTLRPQ